MSSSTVIERGEGEKMREGFSERSHNPFGSPSCAATTTINQSNRDTVKTERIDINDIHSSNSSVSQGNIRRSSDRIMSSKTDQAKITTLPSYPLLDTFSLLCILMIFPHWFSTIFLLLYVFMGNPDTIDSIISMFVKHKLNRPAGSITAKNSNTMFTGMTAASFLSNLSLDSVFMLIIFKIFPDVVPYIILFAKSLMASSITSLRHRYLSDAIKSSILLILVELTIMSMIKHFEIFRGDSLTSTSAFSSMDILYPLYEDYEPSFTKTLLFHLSFHRVQTNSPLMVQIEYAVQFLHSTLSLYLIMHSLNHKLRGYKIINYIYSFFDILSSTTTEQNSPTKDSNKRSAANSAKAVPKIQNSFLIPKAISDSKLPLLENSTPSSNKISHSTLSDSISESAKQKVDDYINTANDSENIPGWFPEDQTTNINDVSSTSFVVAQNFETFCQLIWSSSSQIFGPNSSNASSKNVETSSNNKPSTAKSKKVNPKQKSVTSNDKKSKINALKYQQPLWTFLTAVRTMFLRQDYYSGDFYSNNAIIPTSAGVDDYFRNVNSSPQCFIWFTGETTLGFELHNISLEHLLIKVNGIIWEHVSSCSFLGKELVIISGLSPLSQYDIDFVKITIHGELVHLTTETVATIFQEKILDESNVSSPLSTLQESVKTTLAAIEREQAKNKKVKQDWKKNQSSLMNKYENAKKPFAAPENTKLDNLIREVEQKEKEYTKVSEEFERIATLDAETEQNYLVVKQQYDNELLLFTNFSSKEESVMKQAKEDLRSRINDKKQLLSKIEKTSLKKERIQKELQYEKEELNKLKDQKITPRIESRRARAEGRVKKLQMLTEDIEKILNKSIG